MPAVEAAGAVPAPPVVPWWGRLRDRSLDWLGRRTTRRWLARFPLTRPIARRFARRLFDLSAGFVYTQTLTALVDLGLPERMAEPTETDRLAADVGLPEPTLRRLLEAAGSLGLVRRDRDDRWRLTSLGAALRDNAGLAAMIHHHRALYLDLADPVEFLRGRGTQRIAGFWPYANRADPSALGGVEVADYCQLMTASAPLVIEQVHDAYPLGRHRHLLDVGGGEGAFAEAAARECPDLAVTLFDLPAVAERARRRLATAGLDGRIVVAGGDFGRDPLPRGADLVTVVRILHDHGDDSVRRLLRSIHEALPAGGRILIAEPFAETPGATQVGGAYFGLYLAAMGQGGCRSVSRYRALLHEAGFRRIRSWPTPLPLQTGILTGDR